MNNNAEITLASDFPNIDLEVVKHIFQEVSGKNEQFARETLKTLNKAQIDQIKQSITKKTLSKEQLDQVKNFMGITGAKLDIAQKYMQNNGWKITDAINSFYEGGGVGSGELFKEQMAKKQKELSKMNVKDLFQRYKSSSSNELQYIFGNDIIQFVKDLGVTDIDLSRYILCWKLNCSHAPNSISEKEFILGFQELKCENIIDITKGLKEWKKEIKEKKVFKNFYKFIFKFCTTNKYLSHAKASELWTMAFLPEDYPLITSWNYFIITEYKQPITHDTWIQFFDFITTTSPDMSNYDPDDCWPMVMDLFQESYEKNHKK